MLSRAVAIAGVVTVAIVPAACSDGARDSVPADTTAGVASTDLGVTDTSLSVDVTDSVDAVTTLPEVLDGPLVDVCPATISIQTNGFPGVALGPLYSLLGPTPTVDALTQTVGGPLVRSDGTIEDVRLELRSGGPAVGFENPLTLLGADETITMAQVSTAVAARDARTPSGAGDDATGVVAVVTLTDLSHEAIIIDPATWPGVDDFDALRREAIEIRHVTDSPMIDFMQSTGELMADQLVPGSDGEPASFVESGGLVAQQGDLLVEPVLYPTIPQWAKPVVAIPASEGGWSGHDNMLVVRSGDVVARRDCLGRLVPIIQRAIVAYASVPQATDVVMGAARSQLDPLNRLTPDLMDAGAAAGVAAGVFGNGDDETIGDLDEDRLETFLPEVADALGVDPVDVSDIVTNEFVDPSIGL